MIKKKKILKISLTEQILLIFLIVISLLTLFFYIKISNKCLFVNQFDENNLYKYKNEKIIIIEAPCGKIAIKLFTKIAPINIQQILNLIKNKKYDNSAFYRVKKKELVEFGDLIFGKINNLDYLRIGTGGSLLKNNISELSKNYNFIRGSVGMVRRGKFDTENSQIFILLNNNSSFNNQFTTIGEVVMGIEVLDKIKYNNTSEFVLRPDYVKKAYIYNFN